MFFKKKITLNAETPRLRTSDRPSLVRISPDSSTTITAGIPWTLKAELSDLKKQNTDIITSNNVPLHICLCFVSS